MVACKTGGLEGQRAPCSCIPARLALYRLLSLRRKKERPQGLMSCKEFFERKGCAEEGRTDLQERLTYHETFTASNWQERDIE